MIKTCRHENSLAYVLGPNGSSVNSTLTVNITPSLPTLLLNGVKIC